MDLDCVNDAVWLNLSLGCRSVWNLSLCRSWRNEVGRCSRILSLPLLLLRLVYCASILLPRSSLYVGTDQGVYDMSQVDCRCSMEMLGLDMLDLLL